LEALEARLLLDGQIDYMEVCRGIDYEQPGAGDDQYEYAVEAAAEYLTALQLTTPWGQEVDFSDYLPVGWAGEQLERLVPAEGFWLEAGTEDGQRFIYIEWEALSQAEWDCLDTDATSITAAYVGGSWAGSVDFTQVDQPVQEPTLTDPIHGQTDVPLLPTIHWQPWDVPPIGEGIELVLIDRVADEDLYGDDLPPGATEWTVGGCLEPATTYEVELDFEDHAVVNVNGLDVHVLAAAESDQQFTTAEAGVLYVETARTIDFDEPGNDADDAYEYGMAIDGIALTRLELTTPWGEEFDSASPEWLGPDWNGEYFEYDDGTSWFEGGTDGEGCRYFDIGWDGLTISKWAALSTYDTAVTVTYLGGAWTGSIDFRSVNQPTQEPVLTFPVHGQTDVPVRPTLRWDRWLDPLPGGRIELVLIDQVLDADLCWDDLARDATEWTVPDSLTRATTYEVELDFEDHAVVPVNGIEVDVLAQVESDPQFTTTDASIVEVWLERGRDREAPYLPEAYCEYCVEIVGCGLTDVEIATPWGETADLADLLPPGCEPEEYVEVSRGALELEAESEDGMSELGFYWLWLSDAQWASLDTGQTAITVTLADETTWSAMLDFDDVTQPLREPDPTSPIYRNVEPNDLTVEWAPWDSPPPGAAIDVCIEEIPPEGSWTGDEYEAEVLLPPSATSWTPPTLPDSQGIHGMELVFATLHEAIVDDVPVTTVAFAGHELAFVVGGPEAFVRTDAAGRTYFPTPPGSWFDCQAFAESHGGDLVTLFDADQEAWLQEQYGTDRQYWIGYNDIEEEGKWKWVSGEPSTYTNWAPSEPNDSGEGEDAAVMNGFPPDTRWNDLPAWGWLPGLAMIPPGVVPDFFDDHGNTAADATRLAVPSTADGCLSYFGDIDFFSLNAAAGQTYDILIDLPEGGMDDSTAWLYGADGQTLLTWDDDGGRGYGSRILWTAPAEGTYYLAVDACDPDLAELGAYTVEIALSDFATETPLAVFDHPAWWIVFENRGGLAGSEMPSITEGGSGAVIHLLDLIRPLAPVEVGGCYVGDLEGEAFDPTRGLLYLADESNRWRWDEPGSAELVVLETAGGDPVEIERLSFANSDVDAMTLSGGFLYAGTQDEDDSRAFLEVYDLADPAHPALLGLSDPIEGEQRDFDPDWIVVAGARAYVLHEDAGAVSVLDVGDPTSPTLLGQYFPTGGEGGLGWGMAVSGHTAWVGADRELRAIDLSDPPNPAVQASLPLDGRVGEIVVEGDLAFVACPATGGCVVDISNPADPRVLREYGVRGATGDLAINNGRAYLPTGAGETVILTATLEADADLDADVDQDDFVALRGNFGAAADAMWADGDFDGDGDVDCLDYIEMKRHAGRSLSGGGEDVLAAAESPADQPQVDSSSQLAAPVPDARRQAAPSLRRISTDEDSPRAAGGPPVRLPERAIESVPLLPIDALRVRPAAALPCRLSASAIETTAEGEPRGAAAVGLQPRRLEVLSLVRPLAPVL